MNRLLSAIALALGAAMTLAACGTDNSSGSNSNSSSSSGVFNDADVTFAQSMIPHHEQAVEMAKMSKTHASTADVKQFTSKVEAARPRDRHDDRLAQGLGQGSSDGV